MVDLSYVQYQAVVNAFSLVIAANGIAFIFFLLRRKDVLASYRTPVILVGLTCAIAAYDYMRLTESWQEAYHVVNGAVIRTGVPYDDVFRYADWLLTVPLSLVALVLALDLPLRQARMRSLILGMLSVEMIVLGYCGHVAATEQNRWLWGGISLIPFFIVLQQLYTGWSAGMRADPRLQRLFSMARTITMLTWVAYPFVDVLSAFVPPGSDAFVTLQIGYAVADIVGRIIYGVLICAVAQRKADGIAATTPVPAAPAATPAALAGLSA